MKDQGLRGLCFQGGRNHSDGAPLIYLSFRFTAHVVLQDGRGHAGVSCFVFRHAGKSLYRHVVIGALITVQFVIY